LPLKIYAAPGCLKSFSFNAESFGGRAEAGYRIPSMLGAITPYAAVQAQNFHTPNYSETDVTGLGFGLTNNARNAKNTRSELGGRYDKLVLLAAASRNKFAAFSFVPCISINSPP
jgi:outer membrane autotransporter protein